MPAHFMFWRYGDASKGRQYSERDRIKFQKRLESSSLNEMINFPLCFSGLFIGFELSYIVILTFHLFLYFLLFSYVLGHFQGI